MNYGGRGITITPEWDDFAVFFRDMGPRPPGTSLDRWPDKNGPYAPGNCRWATAIEQQRNLRKTTVVTYQGETLALGDWAERLGIHADALAARLKRGWPIDAAMSSEPGYRRLVHQRRRNVAGQFA